MNKVVNIIGEDAIILQGMIAKARIKWPVLYAVSDEEVVSILIDYAATMQEEACCEQAD